jgi:hypothetical protein
MAPYLDRSPEVPPTDPRIYLEVQPGTLPCPVLALVDTAAPWCIFTPAIGKILRESFEPESKSDVRLSTRLGWYWGRLYRGPLTFPVLEGEPMEIDATVFLSAEWPGDNFLGYEGLLQRMRFAIDPRVNRFYFGHLE